MKPVIIFRVREDYFARKGLNVLPFYGIIIDMTKKEKLFQRVKNNPKNIRFQDFCTLMEYFGFVLIRVRGSHHLYQHPMIDNVMNVQAQKDATAKSYQVQQFLKLIEIHQLHLMDEPEE